jgi:hypothetical protein
MFGPFATRRGVLLYLAVWLMLGLVLTGLVMSATAASWVDALAFAVPLTMVFSVGAGFSAMYLCRAFPLAGSAPVYVVLVFGVTAAVVSAAWIGLALLWNLTLTANGGGVVLGRPLVAMLCGLGVVLYGLCALGHYLVIEFDRTRSAERRELELQLAAQDAELRMLRTQVDPHFLFNSLNSISALTSADPARARTMTLQLSDFFRRTLGLHAGQHVTVADELRLLADFLAIEQVRFGARLGVRLEADDGARACLLPPMLLQPLVENAVKHGIGGLPEGGTISVQARRDGSLLRIQVENPVDADQGSGSGKGIGLANVRQRLAASYAHEANVRWTRATTTFRVELTLPALTEQ